MTLKFNEGGQIMILLIWPFNPSPEVSIFVIFPTFWGEFWMALLVGHVWNTSSYWLCLVIVCFYTCQLSRLQVENFNLTPAQTCGPTSRAWLKNLSCCCHALHNFQKYVNSDPCKEPKPCVNWVNDNTFLVISDFWTEKHRQQARVYTRPKPGTGKCKGCFLFRHSMQI